MTRNRRYGGVNIPSQTPTRRVPLSPYAEPALDAARDMRGVKPIGAPRRDDYTIATYESRPPQTIDFGTELVTPLSSASGEANQAEISFTVPAPRTLVIRSFSFSVDADLDGASALERNVSKFGYDPRAEADLPFCSVLVNRTPADNYGKLRLFDLSMAYHEYECFILVPGGSTVTLFSQLGTALQALVHRTVWRLYGNEILSKGTDVTREPVNTSPVRTVEKEGPRT